MADIDETDEYMKKKAAESKKRDEEAQKANVMSDDAVKAARNNLDGKVEKEIRPSFKKIVKNFTNSSLVSEWKDEWVTHHHTGDRQLHSTWITVKSKSGLSYRLEFVYLKVGTKSTVTFSESGREIQSKNFVVDSIDKAFLAEWTHKIIDAGYGA
jgi:hypothetical protein